MGVHNRQNLNKNEKAIIELVLQGESQSEIARVLKISPSTIYRTLRREHVVNILNQATQGILSHLVQKNLSLYSKALNRIEKEIDTMPLQQVLSFINHVKQTFQGMYIDEAKRTIRELQVVQEDIVKVSIKYSDTDAYIEREVQKRLDERQNKEES